MHVSTALIVNRHRLIGKLLDHFEDIAAALAFVFVNGQLSDSISEVFGPDAAR